MFAPMRLDDKPATTALRFRRFAAEARFLGWVRSEIEWKRMILLRGIELPVPTEVRGNYARRKLPGDPPISAIAVDLDRVVTGDFGTMMNA